MRAVAGAVSDLLNSGDGLYFIEAGDYTKRAIAGTLPAGSPVFDTAPANGEKKPSQYVVFYLTAPMPVGERACDTEPFGLYSLSTMYFAQHIQSARWLMERVRVALEGKRLVLASQTATPLKVGRAASLLPNDAINPSAYVGTDVWRFTVTRGAPNA